IQQLFFIFVRIVTRIGIEMSFDPIELQQFAQEMKYRKSLNELEYQLELLKTRAELENIDIAEKQVEIEKQIADLKSQLPNNAISSLSFAKIIREIEKNKSALQTLEVKKKDLAEDIYNRIKSEYNQNLASARKSFSLEIPKLKTYLKTVEPEIVKLTEKIEELKLRIELEASQEYENLLKETSNQKNQIIGGKDAAKFLLGLLGDANFVLK
ncbi:MAG: hypothetical protein ACFFBD_13395, partial [Candidatus Hodarchaeota archaeon]